MPRAFATFHKQVAHALPQHFALVVEVTKALRFHFISAAMGGYEKGFGEN
jgi:hypothetical protein